MADPEVRHISVLKSTRVGGTLAMVAAWLGLSETDPGPGMIATPDDTSLTEIRDRIYDTAEESATYRHRVPPPRRRHMRHVDLGTMRIFLGNAGSTQSLRGRTCRRVSRHEIDVWPKSLRGGGDPLAASADRVKSLFYSLLYDESSPDGEDSQIYAQWLEGDQRTWQCKCPRCGLYQEFRFFVFDSGPHVGRGGVVGWKDENGNHRSKEDARRDAHYLCLNGCRIDNHEKQDMIGTGVWCPKGQTVVDGRLVGTPEKDTRHKSYHLWSVHVPTISFSDLAVAYLEHYNTNKIKEWFQNWLGLRYRTGRKMPQWRQLGKKFETPYPRAIIPPHAWFLTAGVDVQLHGIYWTVWAWGHMARSWLIDWGYLRRFIGSGDAYTDDRDEDCSLPSTASDLNQLDHAVLYRNFEVLGRVANPLGHTTLKPTRVGIDSNYRKNAVYRYILNSTSNRLRAVRGDNKMTGRDRFRKTIVEKNRSGKKYPQKREQWQINTISYKHEIVDKYQLDRDAPGAILFPEGICGIGQDVLRQMLNERPAEELDRDNRKKIVFKVEDEKLGSHYLDTRVYAEAMAEMLLDELGLTWDTTTWQSRAAEDNSQVDNKLCAAREYQ